MSGTTQAGIYAAYQRLSIENYCIVSTSALLFFDCAVCWSKEYHRVWKRPFSGTTLVYFATRYGAVLERCTLMISLFIQTLNDESCTHVLRIDDFLTDCNYAAMGAFTALRLFGIFGMTRKALIPFLWIVALWIGRISLTIFLQVSYTPLAIGPPLWGCAALWTDPDALYRSDATSNALMLASDTTLLVLTWAKTYTIWKEISRLELRSPVPMLLLRDGTTYFVLIFIIQVLAIISATIGSNFVLFDVWTYFGQVFTVIFLSRFILNLRGVYIQDSDEPGSVTTINPEISDVRFHATSRMVGTLGAPLDIGPFTSRSSNSSDFDLDDEEVEVLEMADNPLMVGLSKKDEVMMKEKSEQVA